MQAKALKTFFHDQLGRVVKGQEFEATAAQLSGVRHFVEVYETKVIREVPNEGRSDISGNQDASADRAERQQPKRGTGKAGSRRS